MYLTDVVYKTPLSASGGHDAPLFFFDIPLYLYPCPVYVITIIETTSYVNMFMFSHLTVTIAGTNQPKFDSAWH